MKKSVKTKCSVCRRLFANLSLGSFFTFFVCLIIFSLFDEIMPYNGLSFVLFMIITSFVLMIFSALGYILISSKELDSLIEKIEKDRG